MVGWLLFGGTSTVMPDNVNPDQPDELDTEQDDQPEKVSHEVRETVTREPLAQPADEDDSED